MSKASILITLTSTFVLLTAASGLKAQTLTDPGLSQHNYKMPNKMAKAKIRERGQHFTISMNAVSEIELTKTAKYSVRPSSIIVAINEKKEPMSINPLSAISNYKTQPVPKMQSAQEEYSASLN